MARPDLFLAQPQSATLEIALAERFTAIATAIANAPTTVRPRYLTSIRTPNRKSSRMASSQRRPRTSRPASLYFSTPPKLTRARRRASSTMFNEHFVWLDRARQLAPAEVGVPIARGAQFLLLRRPADALAAYDEAAVVLKALKNEEIDEISKFGSSANGEAAAQAYARALEQSMEGAAHTLAAQLLKQNGG